MRKARCPIELDIKIQTQNGILTICLSGRLTYKAAPEFDRAFSDSLDGIREVRIDMSELVYISSMGIQSVLSAKKAASQKGAKFFLLSPGEAVMDVFRVTGLDDTFDIIYPDAGGKEAPELYPLRPIQRWMTDTQFVKAKSTMTNVGALVNLEQSVDLQALAKAVNSVIADNDIFRCRFVIDKNTGDICQRFDGEVKPVVVEEMTPEDFAQAKGGLRHPFEFIGHQLWNMRIINAMTGKYFFMDFFNGLMDGVVIVMVLWREINRRYTALTKETDGAGAGTRIRRSSSYASYIADEMNTPRELAEEGRLYWQKMLDGFDTKKHLPPMDSNNTENNLDEFEVPLNGIDKSFFSGKNFTEHTFFLGATLLTMAKTTHRPEAIMIWVHNGRTTKSEMSLMGIMLEQFPIRWEFVQEQTVREFLAGLGDKLRESMIYRKSLDYAYNTGIESDTACFIFQKGTIGRRGRQKLGDTWAEIIELEDETVQGAESPMDIELNAHDDGTFSLVMHYNTGCYSRETMTRFTEVYREMTDAMKDENCELLRLLEQ